MDTKKEKYIIALSKSRSVMAFIACLVTIIFTFYAIAGGIVIYVRDGKEAGLLFRWFTTLSNMITCFSASMLIPYAVEGIRKKHFAFPKWISLFLYCGVVCTTLTMSLSLGFMSWNDPETAFGGYNTYLHVICPIMVIVAFFMVESGFRYSVKNALMVTIPVFIYVAVYAVEVAVIGEENGGWEDIYHVMEYVPVPVAIIGVPAVALGLSMLIRLLNNLKVKKRYQKLMSRLLPEEVSSTEIKVELFGLGRFMGKHSDPEYADLHLDIINNIAKHYNLKSGDVIKPFVKGLVDSLNEKDVE